MSKLDVRRKDSEGLTICPECNGHFKPELGERMQPEACIQDEFPNATAMQREQLLTGLCSDKCWNKFLGQ